MSNSKLPERPSLEYLKKLAKDRLAELRRTDPHAKLASALLAIARDHGFPSWRALKAEAVSRQTGHLARFFEACRQGDAAALRALVDADPALVRAADPQTRHSGWTGLHTAAQQGHLDAIRLLLAQGADPNAREEGDNTTPLHWAAATRRADNVRALLDAGADVHGLGDLHELDVIGWATFFHESGGAPGDRPEVAAYLVEHGARHHIFSAMSLGSLDLIRDLVEHSPEALDRRMSRFENRLTPLHLAIQWKRYAILDLLIELGADLEAPDGSGNTALESAIVSGDREAINRLQAAGAKPPKPPDLSNFRPNMAALGSSVRKIIPMIHVPDIARTLEWYTSIGFTEVGRYEDNGLVNWGMLSYGGAELMLNMHGKAGEHEVSLWFYTTQIDQLYALLKSRQFGPSPIHFVEYLYEPPYGGREFGIRDLNGYNLFFLQQDHHA